MSVLFWLFFALFALWLGTALWIQFPMARLWAMAGLALASGLVLWARLGPDWGWSALFVLAALGLGWFFTLKPQQDRNWEPDVAHIVKGRVEGDLVHVENIRNFRWETADLAKSQAWESRVVDLNKINGIDMVTSVWGNPKIAHLLVSFRFSDSPPLTFSVEIRREKGEKFSPIGGFFRQFELSLIAAEEADILQWRAVPRDEEVRLYPLRLSREQMKTVFLSFIDLGNELNAAPQWYNTATANCASVVWTLTKAIDPALPWDKSLLMSGLLPEFLDRFKALAGDGTVDEKRARALISTRAREIPPGADFSRWIRGN